MSRHGYVSPLFGLFVLIAGACATTETTSESDAGSPSPNKVGSAGKSAAGDGGSGGAARAGSTGSTPSTASKAGSGGSSGVAGHAAGSGGDLDQDAGVDGHTPGSRECVVGGCSSQLCTDSASGPVISTCEWREEYGCYRDAICAQQADAKCGWTQTPALKTCLQGAGAQP